MFQSHRVRRERSESLFREIALMCVIAWGPAVASNAFAQSGPKIFSWGINQNTPTSGTAPLTTPMPWSDQWNYWNDAAILNTYQTYQANAGKYVGLLIRGEQDGPLVNFAYQSIDASNYGYYYSDGYINKTVNGSPVTPYYNQTEADGILAQYPRNQRNTVTDTANWLNTNVGRTDYVFMDFENASHLYNGAPLRDPNVRTAVQQVHAVFSNAKLGNYADFPGTEDLSELSPSRIDRTNYWAFSFLGIQSDRNAFYLNSGLNVAMPNLYPYSYNLVHAGSAWNNFRGENYVSPTQRSALFWAPLEKLSTAKRALPAGHELIPWVNDFIQWSGYNLDAGQTPTLDDNKASIMHYRLRGADGYYAFHATMDNETYRGAAYAAWSSLDPLFNRAGAQRILNLTTNKIAGIEWSGVEKGNRAQLVVSNLNTYSQSIDWSGKLQLPKQSPTVAANTHVMLQYRTSYLDNNDMQQYTAGNAMNNQGADSWSGPQPGEFSAAAPPGTGNDSSQAVVTTGGYNSKIAWHNAANPGYTSADKVVYSAYLYEASSTIGFSPVNTVGTSPTGRPDFNHQGPSVSLNWGTLKLRGIYDAGTVYQAANFTATLGKWYEVQLAVDPTSGTGLGSIFVRNVTDGQKDFTRIVFDDTSTSGTTERLWQVPLALATNRNTTNFNGWQVSAYGAGNAIDNLNTGYYVPRMNDNFEHYQTGVTNNNQPTTEIQWHGPAANGPASWTVAAPSGSGNSSSLVATLAPGMYNARAWWKTENPDFAITEPTVYSAQLYGTSGVGFEAVNTTANNFDEKIANNRVGFYAYIYWGALCLRGTRDNGDNFQATNFTAQSGKWYDIQVQIDPTRDIDGSAGGNFGVARVWVKNLTDNTDPLLVIFDNLATTGSTESLTELPMYLTTNLNNPTLWDGWEVYGNSNVQIDGLRSFLYPYADYLTYNQYIDDANPNNAAFKVLLVPEPASCALLAIGMIGLIRGRRSDRRGRVGIV